MPLRRLLPFLFCPLCAVNKGNSLLHDPFTLHCGHTVCSSHLESLSPTQRCPLPVCSSTPNSNTSRPNIPSSSTVVYLPAPPSLPAPQQAANTSTEAESGRVDITISKLIEVVSRHSPPLVAPDPGDFDLYDHVVHPQDASSDEESTGRRRRLPRAPEISSQSTAFDRSPANRFSADSRFLGYADSTRPSLPTGGGETPEGSGPPRKRPRRDSGALVTDLLIQSGTEIGSSDDSTPNRQQPNRPGPEHGQQEELQTRVDKELLTELSCEICFAIYYQPVTTPCQHVSSPFLHPGPIFFWCFYFYFFSRSGTNPRLYFSKRHSVEGAS